MKKLINKWLSYLGYQIKKVSIETKRERFFRIKYNIDLNDFDIVNNDLYSKKLNLLIENKDFEILLEGYEFAVSIRNVLGATFKYDESRRLICEISNQSVKFYINSAEELYIIKEVYADGIYNVILNDKQKIQLLDIGMNVGVTSLFFANRPNVEKIIGFEPFPATFRFSQDNFNINKQLSSKIQSYNFGISNRCSREKWKYNLKYKGSVGFNGLGKNFNVPEDTISEEWIELVDIRKIFDEYIHLNNDLKLIVKIDCEGSEYEIIKSLSDSDMLEYIDILFIEWHFQGPDILLKELIKNGFRCLCFNCAYEIGMIYAFSSNA